MQNKLSFGISYASAIIAGEPAEFCKNFAGCSDGISEVSLGRNSDPACDTDQNFTYDFTSNSTQDFTDISDCEQNSINSVNFTACENNESAGRDLAAEGFNEKSTEFGSQRELNHKAVASKFSSARAFDCGSEEAAELYKNLAACEGEALQNSSVGNLKISAHARLKDEILALEALKKKPALAHIPPLQRRRLGLGAKLCISLLGEISQNTPQSLAEDGSLNLASQDLDASKSRTAAQNPSPQDFSSKNSSNFMPQNLNSTPQDLINENSLNSARQNFKTNDNAAVQREGLPLVFCSRMGEINRCFSLLGSMSESVSPSSFCVSVLNAIAAQNAIFTQNHAEISTISAACALENGAIIAAARLKESAENSGSAQDANEDGKNDECKSYNDKIALLCYFEEANNDYLKRCDFACALLLVLQRGDDVQIEISPHVTDAQKSAPRDEASSNLEISSYGNDKIFPNRDADETLLNRNPNEISQNCNAGDACKTLSDRSAYNAITNEISSDLVAQNTAANKMNAQNYELQTAKTPQAENSRNAEPCKLSQDFKRGGEIPLDTAVEFLAKILSGKHEWHSSDGVLDYLWRVKDPAKIAAFLRQDRER